MSWEAWGDPPDPEDPLENVEYPRERKPGKRDRDAARFAMQCRINERCRANPMIVDSRGEPSRQSKDHSLRFAELNRLHQAIYRWRVIESGSKSYTGSRAQRFEDLARLHRIAQLIPYFDKAPLP